MSDEQWRVLAMNEADTCRELVTPAIRAAGWGDSPYLIGEQRTFTDGRIEVMRLLAEIEALVAEVDA